MDRSHWNQPNRYQRRGSRGGFSRGRGGPPRRNSEWNDQPRYPKKLNYEKLSEGIPDPEELPIFRHKEKILKQLNQFNVGIIEGATGSGKTTQVPKYILERWPDSKIVISQPRRLPTIQIATRVAEEMETEIGEVVGYHIKGIKKYNENSRIIYMTTGMLVQELCGCETIKEHKIPWNFVVMDEVHERSIETDFLLVIFKYLLAKKSNFKLILMSATMEKIIGNYFAPTELSKLENTDFSTDSEEWEEEKIEKLSNQNENSWTSPEDVWNNSWVNNPTPASSYKSNIARIENRFEKDRADKIDSLSTDSRLFKVDLIYIDELIDAIDRNNFRAEGKYDRNYINTLFIEDSDTKVEEVDNIIFDIAAYTIKYQHLIKFKPEERLSTFLVFLPGIQEINYMYDKLEDICEDIFYELDICILHSSIPEEQHEKVLELPSPDKRRIILSTNIAESSVTLIDVRFIIDFGFLRQNAFNSNTMADNLELVWAAKSVMKQRAGRVGRVADGVVFRLMPEGFFNFKLYDYAKPEIQRCSLDKLVLKLKQLNFGNPRDVLGKALQPPDEAEIAKTEKYLQEMGGLDSKKNITPLGKLYADMPYDIRVTRLCMFGLIFGCFRDSMVIGAILSLERPPLQHLANLPSKFSKKHPETYQARYNFDNGCNSDLISYLNAYDIWYREFGYEVEKIMFRNGRNLRKPPVTLEEKEFCRNNCLDPNALRENLNNYKELEKRFEERKIDKRHFQYDQDCVEKRSPASEEVFRIKLCIAAAYSGKYLLSKYEIDEAFTREKLCQKIGKNCETSIMIPDIPDFITQVEIENLIKGNSESPERIFMSHSSAVITYKKNVRDRTLKYVLWLGSYYQRYNNLAWLVSMDTVRNPETGELWEAYPSRYADSKMQEALRISKRNFAASYKRENIIKINENQYRDCVKATEIAFLERPEYPYKLRFFDVMTRYSIKIEEDSINAVCICRDEKRADRKMAVCCEYVEKRNFTIARNSTIMPEYPNLPQILTLIFSPNAEFFADDKNTRYDSFRVHNSVNKILFDFEFTGYDVEIINEIRKEISILIFDDKYIKHSELSNNIRNNIKKLLKADRIRIERELPNWKKLINWNKTIENPHKFEDFEIDNSYNGYLPAIKPLPIDEDPRHWQPNSEELFSNDLSEIHYKKELLIADIEKNGKIAALRQAEFVCAVCSSTICSYQCVKQFNKENLFMVTGYSGLNEVDTVNDDDLVNEISQKYDPERWVVCARGHTIGWVERDHYIFSEKSPVAVLFPTLYRVDWNPELWNNDMEKLYILAEEYASKAKYMEISSYCSICMIQFKTIESFSVHVNLEESHKLKTKDFLIPYIS
ncbi:unnamed protein product [Blepharisma stoltei]|uniref:RNA helicase n=1 Tax=Blepharisma stoltei TaxID=1481888 RepID=A0AAU9J1X1_9CILI|nr:unnamed protein product [Blepharisma stoltei]